MSRLCLGEQLFGAGWVNSNLQSSGIAGSDWRATTDEERMFADKTAIADSLETGAALTDISTEVFVADHGRIN